MQIVQEFFSNKIILAALTGWISAQLLKVVLVLMVTKKLDLHRLMGSGGMPSSHSAMVIATTMMCGYEHGVGSAAFAVAFVFSVIVIYDATGVRRQAGEHAKMLNRVAYTLERENEKDDQSIIKFDELQELLGHTPIEVMGGIVLGLLVSIILK